uniref:NME/NM23 nucleoside diphosphate kinase 6 n=1 Tax=Pipistrellus kuhlii TaxID=59472 RepID=A0A7J7WDQ0_PIPKU|nr:NME/NM23 nucleoside diphosphate kinase 6 [Pipistrellus kuhlii]
MASAWRSPQALQLTLALVKPDAVAHPLILEAVHQQILSSQLLIVRRRELVWRREDCRRFYQEHEGRFFYQRLVEFMARRHPALEDADGAHQGVPGAPRGPRLHPGQFGPHRHPQHHPRLR